MLEDDVEFHNITDLRRTDEATGRVVERIPERTRVELNEGARSNYRRPAGSEIRFRLASGVARVTLSSPDGPIDVIPYWGPFQDDAVTIGPEPTAVELAPPERLADLDPAVVDTFAYHPDLCRVVLPHRSGPIHYHGVRGRRSPAERRRRPRNPVSRVRDVDHARDRRERSPPHLRRSGGPPSRRRSGESGHRGVGVL